MKINLVHGKHLCISTPCSSALHAKARAQRGFPQRHHCFLAYLVHAQRQSHTHGGLANTGLGGRGGGHQYQMVFAYLLIVG